ncbi:MAG: sodium-dependent transporter [Bacteroidota bacterium]
MKEQFSSRWGLILASLGMAIGAGNLWRFPRLAGQYGGTFLVLWISFLFIWSIPILLAEFSMGKEVKKGVIGSFGTITGKSYTWMGFFIAMCTLGIAFYYSVVTAWGIRYLGFSLFNGYQELTGGVTLQQKLTEDPQHLILFWESLSSENLLTVGLHILAVVIGCLLLYRGIQQGLERANKLLIPTLFVLMVLISILSLNMEKGVLGLEYMFSIKPELFRNPTVWIEALSQSAWSTGAGWGLMMTLSAYSKQDEDVTLNIFISGFGNNTASLLAGFAILPAVFALASNEADAVSYLQSGNQALTFSIIPSLFSGISGGIFLSIVFFVAFCLAAFSSFLAMLELFILLLGDLNIPRKKAVLWVGGICILMGLPSAWSLDFFNNQDWVWGIGLIISGMFIIFSVLKNGAKRFKEQYIDKDSDFQVNTAYFVSTLSLNLVFALILIYWWMSRGYDANPWWDESGNWNVRSIYSNATIVTQWGALILIGILLNGWLYRKFVVNKTEVSESI